MKMIWFKPYFYSEISYLQVMSNCQHFNNHVRPHYKGKHDDNDDEPVVLDQPHVRGLRRGVRGQGPVRGGGGKRHIWVDLVIFVSACCTSRKDKVDKRLRFLTQLSSRNISVLLEALSQQLQIMIAEKWQWIARNLHSEGLAILAVAEKLRIFRFRMLIASFPPPDTVVSCNSLAEYYWDYHLKWTLQQKFKN